MKKVQDSVEYSIRSLELKGVSKKDMTSFIDEMVNIIKEIRREYAMGNNEYTDSAATSAIRTLEKNRMSVR